MLLPDSTHRQDRYCPFLSCRSVEEKYLPHHRKGAPSWECLMAIESYEVHTINCDIPGCKEKKTSHSIEVLFSEGWMNLDIFQKQFDLCPEHQEILREFFLSTAES